MAPSVHRLESPQTHPGDEYHRLIGRCEQGIIDGCLLRQVLEFSDPYFVSASLLLVHAGSPVRGVEDLAGKTVAVIEGSVQEKDLALVVPGAKRVAFKNIGEAVQALRAKKADALCQDDMLILALAKENRDLSAVGKPILPRPYAIAVRKGDLATLRWVNEKLSAMKKDGTHDRLKDPRTVC